MHRTWTSPWRDRVAPSCPKSAKLQAIPIGIAFNIIHELLTDRQPLRYLVRWLDDTAGARLTAVTAIGGVQQLAMLVIITPAVIQAVVDIHRGEVPGVFRSYRMAARRSLAIAGAFPIVIVLAGVPLLLVIGLPVAIWLLIRWQFFVQALVIDTSQTSTGALRESARLVKNRWWKTLGTVFIFDLMAAVPGIAVGFGLLTLGRTAVGFANSVSSVLYSLAIPVAVIAVTLMYLDRREANSDAPDTVRPNES